jgi:hypothetical protein
LTLTKYSVTSSSQEEKDNPTRSKRSRRFMLGIQ